MASNVHILRPFSSAALIAGGVGTWEYDVAADRYTLDPVAAALFGFTRAEGAAGISLAQIKAAVHPDGRQRGVERTKQLIADGGMYVMEYRMNAPGPERWVLVRGRQVRDATTGIITHRRGIAVDITAEKGEGYMDGCVSAPAAPPPEEPLDQAVDAALAAHAAILLLDETARRPLLPIIELLLHELGKRAVKEG